MTTARPTLASGAPRAELRAGFGVGSMVTEPQRALGYGVTFVPELRPGLRFAEPLVAELALASWFFPATAGSGRATLLGAGLRFDPKLTSRLSLFVDGHAGVGLTGDNNRFMFDAGAGLEYAISRSIAVGPFLRYGQVADARSDPKFVAGGVLITLAWPADQPASPPPSAPPAAARAPSDRDRDGVADLKDACPDQAAGPMPDPIRRGCPLADSDNDGIANNDDRCPTVPQGPTPDPQQAGCPDGDDDKDGVPNGLDKCRDQPLGMHPDPVAMGCPLPDRDKDAVPDIYDTCPDKPGAPDREPRKNGCPGLVQIDGQTIKILKPVFFATNKDVILATSFPVLRAVAGALAATPGIKKLSIEGHTDGQGTPEENLDLSRRRAESIRRWLIENGIEAERLQATGHGDTRPVASNKTAKGRAENRRVELIILDPSSESGAPQ